MSPNFGFPRDSEQTGLLPLCSPANDRFIRFLPLRLSSPPLLLSLALSGSLPTRPSLPPTQAGCRSRYRSLYSTHVR